MRQRKKKRTNKPKLQNQAKNLLLVRQKFTQIYPFHFQFFAISLLSSHSNWCDWQWIGTVINFSFACVRALALVQHNNNNNLFYNNCFCSFFSTHNCVCWHRIESHDWMICVCMCDKVSYRFQLNLNREREREKSAGTTKSLQIEIQLICLAHTHKNTENNHDFATR